LISNACPCPRKMIEGESRNSMMPESFNKR
jgi:hypothetical protein